MTHWREPWAVTGIGELLGTLLGSLACAGAGWRWLVLAGADWVCSLRPLSSNHRRARPRWRFNRGGVGGKQFEGQSNGSWGIYTREDTPKGRREEVLMAGEVGVQALSRVEKLKTLSRR